LAKIILLVLGLLLAWWILKNYRRQIDGDEPSGGAPEDMVQCERCGVHLPRSESVIAAGKHYCCVEHRREPASG